MSFHQISDGSRVCPDSLSTAAARLDHILADRVRLDAEHGLVSTAAVVRHHARPTEHVRGAIPLARGAIGECYTNALQAVTDAAARGECLRYVEGYAYQANLDLAIEHAWVEDDAGRAFDVTWPEVDEVRAYRGLHFDLSTVVDALASDPGPLLFGDWARGFDLLSQHRTCCKALPW